MESESIFRLCRDIQSLKKMDFVDQFKEFEWLLFALAVDITNIDETENENFVIEGIYFTMYKEERIYNFFMEELGCQ